MQDRDKPCPVDEQSRREAQYLYFDGEDETDYTAGPVRMVNASDGVKQDCTALLMTLDLSAKIQEAVRARREFSAAEKAAERQDDVNYNFENKLEAQIAKHEHRLLLLKDVVDEERVAEAKILQDELTKLQLLLENTKARRQCIAADIKVLATNLQEVQAELNAVLAEAFVSARLVEPAVEEPEEPLQELDIDEEYQRPCYMIQDSANDPPMEAAVFHPCDELGVEPMSAEERHIVELKSAYWEAKQDLAYAEAALDRREDTRSEEWEAHEDAVANGEPTRDASLDEFNIRWFYRTAELTGEVIEAETALASAKAALVNAGVGMNHVDSDQESGFVDDVEDGYAMSFGQDRIQSADEQRILAWLEHIPEGADPDFRDSSGPEAALDECAIWEADMSGSYGAVDVGPGRTKIDRWADICRSMRQD
jgi:hypothetical protein